jgi:uncharacterized protein (DUF111 family)
VKSRVKLAREMHTVKTTYGKVRVKLGYRKGEVVSVHPEYDDCRARAAEKGVTLRKVVDAARRASDALVRDGSLIRAWREK